MLQPPVGDGDYQKFLRKIVKLGLSDGQLPEPHPHGGGENGVVGGMRGDSLSQQAAQEEPGKGRECSSGPGGLGLG